MRELLVRFDQALGPLLTLSRIVGVYPFDAENRFSKILFVYSLCLGLPLATARMVRVVSWKAINDAFLWGSIFLTQLLNMLAWFLFYFYVTRSIQFSEALDDLKKLSKNGVKIPLLSYSVVLLKIMQATLLLCMDHEVTTINGIIILVVQFVAKSPVILVPLQFSSLTEITTQIVFNEEQRMENNYLDPAGSFLLHYYRICQMFRKINTFYDPIIQISTAFVFCFCPTFAFIAMKSFMIKNKREYVFLVTEMLITFYTFLVFVRTSHSLRTQAKRINEKVKEHSRLCGRLNEKIILFIEYNPKIDPKCSSFKINYSLITKLCGTCLTYMIILLQFVHT